MWGHRKENNKVIEYRDAAMQEDRKMRGKVAVGLLSTLYSVAGQQ